MSDSPSLSSLWLDTLASVRHHFQPGELAEVWRTTRLIESRGLSQVWQRGVHAEGEDHIWITPVRGLPEIEAREILLYVLACQVAGTIEKQSELCAEFGCLNRSTLSIAERWRKLACLRSLADLPYAGLETRPACKICGGCVATGSGWTPESSGLDPSIWGSYRPDLHHECKNFALTILAPKYKAQQQAEAAKAAGVVDK